MTEIVLTSNYDGNRYMLNTDHIISYIPRDYGRYTEIRTVDGLAYNVRESMETIKGMIFLEQKK